MPAKASYVWSSFIVVNPNPATPIAQVKEAIRDGLRAVVNCINDGAVVQGAGAFEVACASHLRQHVKKTVQGRAKLGVEAFAESLLVIPKVLAENSGFDAQESNIKLTEEYEQVRHPSGSRLAAGCRSTNASDSESRKVCLKSRTIRSKAFDS